MNPKIKVFYSYSHADDELRAELDKHLAMVKRNEAIEVWYDRALIPGDNWDDKIKTELQEADIIISLVSADFISSNYIWEVELKEAMRRHEAEEALLVSVILRPCSWRDAPFSKWQLLPRDGKPVVEWDNQDTALLDVVNGIKQAVEFVKKRKEEAPAITTTDPPPTEVKRERVLINSFTDYARKLIKYNKQDKLFGLLETFVREGQAMEDRILLLSSRWEGLKASIAEFTISGTEMYLEKAKINRGIVDILNQIDDFSFEIELPVE